MNKLTQFSIEKGMSDSTFKLYSACVKAYEHVNHLSLDELLEEADREEEEGIRWKKRTLKTRLLDFRKYLFENKSEGTANRYMGCIKSIYRHFEIELQDLPSFASKQIDKTYEKTYEDIPSKEELIDAYYEANNVCKCIILFASSSGLSKVDLLNLTVDDFIVACTDYISEGDLSTQLKELKAQKEVIPCFEGCRQKTKSRYTTFCSPEATEHIVQYLIGRDAKIREAFNASDDDEYLSDQLYGSDKLFDISYAHLSYVFRKINNKLGMGTVGKYTKFRCHQLRAYQASTLLNNGLTESEVDALQGRRKDKTHRAYFVESKSKLFNKYYACVDELMLFKSIHTIDEEAFEKVKAENNFFKKEIVKSERKLEEQQEVINEIITNQKELEALLGL